MRPGSTIDATLGGKFWHDIIWKVSIVSIRYDGITTSFSWVILREEMRINDTTIDITKMPFCSQYIDIDVVQDVNLSLLKRM